MNLSVIIPTLNEATCLSETISELRNRCAGKPPEVIVADCGSTDATMAIAAGCGARRIAGPRITNRARACNAGAAAASGDVLLFLHADCRPPQNFDASIERTLAKPKTVGGAFEFRLDGVQWRLRFVELVNRVRYRLRGRYFGDQGIFIRRSTFARIGGFPDIGILEDAHLSARARREGLMRLVPRDMFTSPRRFYDGGILRILALDFSIVVLDLLGLDAQCFASNYRRNNLRRASSAKPAGGNTRDPTTPAHRRSALSTAPRPPIGKRPPTTRRCADAPDATLAMTR